MKKQTKIILGAGALLAAAASAAYFIFRQRYEEDFTDEELEELDNLSADEVMEILNRKAEKETAEEQSEEAAEECASDEIKEESKDGEIQVD